MSFLEIRDFSFSYPLREKAALSGITLDVEAGDFVLVCGKSGSGKTTLLRCMKPELAPEGSRTGTIKMFGRDVLSPAESAEKIGFVMQDPDNQIVMDSVWLELAFGMENLAVPPEEIGRRIGEIAGFFGITSWFGKSVFSLSGGQKQILNLASVIAMQADLIILDEPTSQLDPIATKEFMQMLKRVNTELGKTVILSEHRFEETLSLCDKVVYLDEGELKYSGSNRTFAGFLNETAPSGFAGSLPAPARLALRCDKGITDTGGEIPLDVREGRAWLIDEMLNKKFSTKLVKQETQNKSDPPVLAAHDLWYQYEKADGFVIKGLETEIYQGMINAYVGGNGCGKSTLMKLLAGIYSPHKGRVVRSKGQKVSLLPQDIKSVFVCDTVGDDLTEHIPGISKDKVDKVVERLGIGHLLGFHPYDLSGGEMQKAALAKTLLTEPDILLLDEPCRGMDVGAREVLAGILQELKNEGKAIAFVTHDIEFAAENADRCSMLFGSAIIAEDNGREFFVRNMFYTTSINRMTRGLLEGCILESDVRCD